MISPTVPRKLWEHPDPQSTAMYKFMQSVNKTQNQKLSTYNDFYQYSISHRAAFWDQCFQFLNIIHHGTYTTIVDETARIDSVPRWFEGVHLNFAENLLYSRAHGASSARGKSGKEDDKIALTQVREGASDIRNVSWAQLRNEVGKVAAAMRAHGVRKGDRIVVVASNSVDTLRVFLATTWLGGLFSSSSTDLGVKGVLQRALQVSPRYIFMDDFAVYNGKVIDLRQKMAEIVEGMRDVRQFEGMVSMPRFPQAADITHVPRTTTLSSFIGQTSNESPPPFEHVAFHEPLFIAYSSGTTGRPKCIVHSVGGALLSSAKETVLHREIEAESVTLQYTTTGWIMYFASVMHLFAGARNVLYDGSPLFPEREMLLDLMAELKVTMLGTSPRWMHEMSCHGVRPRDVADLSSLKMVTSTGMVLSDQLFEWFYDLGFPKHVHLANISGGTDIAGCFGLENPLAPVYVGGAQGPTLGIPVAVYDPLIEGGKGVQGAALMDGTPGELVASAAFPSMPVFFWNDPSGSRYQSAYFEKYDNVWAHGDFVMLHPVTNSLIFLGRADGVLNPSGVRFGSAEIYNVIETGFPGVADSVCVGQRRPQDADESVMLFLLMRPGHQFTDDLVRDVKAAVRRELSPRHVPRYVFETPEIPMTVNLKKVELPVKQIVSGNIVQPSGTLLNPGSLDYYYRFARIEEVVAATTPSRDAHG